MYEKVRSQSLVVAEPIVHDPVLREPSPRDPSVAALLDLLDDLNDENTQLTELVGILQKQLVLARLRNVVEIPCFS
jgi:hypothetical protein